MTTDRLPQQLDLDFGGCDDASFRIVGKATLVAPNPPSAEIIQLENYFLDRQERKTVLLYEHIFDSIKHIG